MKGTGHVPGELGTQRELPRTLREAWPVAVFPLPLGMSWACSPLVHRLAQKLTKTQSILYVFLDYRSIIIESYTGLGWKGP